MNQTHLALPVVTDGKLMPRIGKSAVFSHDRRYRYELWRQWEGRGFCCFIGLNPSTADENTDDPTIRRCIGFARQWGYGGLCMLNLFAFRATDPELMKREPEPIGVSNNATLARICSEASVVVAAWGVHGAHMGRGLEVMRGILNLHCLGLTKDGFPKHPLYLPKDAKPHPMLPVGRLVAVLDGPSDNSDVGLYREDPDGDTLHELPWPAHWPSWVSTEFLRNQGFEVKRA